SNIASLGAQRRLGESTTALTRTFERLNPGLRINRASDDAAGLSVAASLRVDARGFDQGLRNVNDGISYLNVADGAAGQLTLVLTRLKELAAQSANGVYSNTQRSQLDSERQALEVTQAFLPLLRQAAAARVINVSSGYGQLGGLAPDVPS